MSNQITNKRVAIATLGNTGTTKTGLPYITGSVAFKTKGAPDSFQNFIAFGKAATNMAMAGVGSLIVIGKGTEKESKEFTRANGEVATAMDLTINYAYALPRKAAVAV